MLRQSISIIFVCPNIGFSYKGSYVYNILIKYAKLNKYMTSFRPKERASSWEISHILWSKITASLGVKWTNSFKKRHKQQNY